MSAETIFLLILVVILITWAAWGSSWLADRHTERKVRLGNSTRLLADIDDASDPDELPTTPLPDYLPSPAKGIDYRAIRFQVGRGIAQKWTRGQVIQRTWGYTRGNNYTEAGKRVDELAREFGFPAGYPDWQLLASIQDQTTLVINTARGSRRIARD